MPLLFKTFSWFPIPNQISCLAHHSRLFQVQQTHIHTYTIYPKLWAQPAACYFTNTILAFPQPPPEGNFVPPPLFAWNVFLLLLECHLLLLENVRVSYLFWGAFLGLSQIKEWPLLGFPSVLPEHIPNCVSVDTTASPRSGAAQGRGSIHVLPESCEPRTLSDTEQKSVHLRDALFFLRFFLN